jgi:anti-sigma B factor antagonist
MDAAPRTATELTAQVELSHEVGHIVLAGQLDRTGEATILDAYTRATATGATAIEIDFKDVDYINSTGIALVVRLLAEARKDGRDVRARGLTEHYRQIFTITRLSDFMTIVDDEEAQA